MTLEGDVGDALFAVAAADATEGCIVIANHKEYPVALQLETEGQVTGCLLTADDKIEEEVVLPAELPAFSILVTVQTGV